MTNYFNNLRVHNAENFIKLTSNLSASLYTTFGKNQEWPNDLSPPTEAATTATEYDVWFNMIGAKKITSNDIRQCIRRVDWSENTVYSQYDDQNANLFSNNFYVLTSDNRVYKCLNNKNGSNSTVEPTSTNTSATTTLSDGYRWKYMYSLSEEDILRFTLDDYIPIRKLENDDGSDQWDIQDNAVKGAVHSIIVTNSGSGYTNTDNIIITIVGDGTGAYATVGLNVVAQTVTHITMVTEGSGYTRANAYIFGGGGTNAAARVVIAPFGGHGSNPTYELGASNVLVNTKFIGNQNDKYPDTTEFRQISILKDPLKNNSAVVSTNTVVSQTMQLSLYNYAIGVGVPTDYDIGEEVYQGTSISDYTFKGRVVDWDATNNIVSVTQTLGSPTTTQSLYGNDSTTNKVINAVIDPELESYTGQILYVDNFEPITKDPDQTEDIKVLIKF